MLRRALHLARMLRNERAAPERLRALQSERLRALVRHAARTSPFYRDLYAAHGVDPDAFGGLADLGSLPVIDKRLLRQAGDAWRSREAPRGRVAIRTSGSSGEPFEFHIDRDHDQWRKAQYLRPYFSNGRGATDRVLRLTAFPAARMRWFARLGLLPEWQLDCASDPAEIVATWRRIRPAVLQGYPSSLRSLAHYCRERGESLHPAPRRIFSDSELLTPATRALIETTLGTPVTDVFGTFETDNIAWQCGLQRGYHVAVDCVILEILRDGRPVAAGEEGELVVTVLGNRTIPFIRYNLHDVGRYAADACPCGSTFPVLEVVSGRADDRLVLADGSTRSAGSVLGRLDQFARAMRQYQLRQLSARLFELCIVPSADFDATGTEPIVRAIAPLLAGAEVRVRLVEQAPRDPSGKLRPFVSELPRAPHA